MLRRPFTGAVLAACVVSALASAGCSDSEGRDLPPEWRGRDLTEPGWAEGAVPRGWALGLEYVWSSGKEVRWDWFVNGSGILHFQVVRMQDGEAQPLVSRFGNESAAGLTVPQPGAHQILWRNEGPVEMRFWYHVPDGHGAPRLYSPTEGPDCAFLRTTTGAGTTC
jgi:hypothetical protein